MAVTLKDIAVKANVSVGAVSRILNGKELGFRASDATRQRVLAVARELNYSPNLFARSLKSRKSNMIGVVISYLIDPYAATIIHGVHKEISMWGYRMLLLELEAEPDPLKTCRDMLCHGNVDGAILVGSSPKLSDDMAIQMEKEGLKIVSVGRHISDAAIPSIRVDDEKGGYLATEHLLSLGHRDIAFFAVHSGNDGRKYFSRRMQGACKSLKDCSLGPDDCLQIHIDANTHMLTGAAAAYAAMQRQLQQGARPTALVTFSDTYAFGAVMAICEAGLKVPQDISVIGYDDMSGIAAYYNPPLTTIRQPMLEMGRLGAERVLDLIGAEGKCDDANILLEPELVVRGSTQARQ